MLNASRKANALHASAAANSARSQFRSAPHSTASAQKMPAAQMDASMFELPKIPDRRLPPKNMPSASIAGKAPSSLLQSPVDAASTLIKPYSAAIPAITAITRRANAPSKRLCSATSRKKNTAMRIFEPSRRWNLPDMAQKIVSHDHAA